MRRATALLGSVLFGCASDEVLLAVPDLPADVTRIGVLFEDGLGITVASSALESVADGRTELRVLLPEILPARARVVGFRSETLAAFAADDSPIRRKAPGQVGLAPDFAGVAELLDREGTVTIDPEPPLIGADWLPQCEHPVVHPEDLVVDTNCAASACRSSVRTDGCRFDVDTEACGLGTLEGLITPRGMVLTSAALRECIETEVSEVERRFVCESQELECRVDLLRGPFSPAFDVKARTLVEVTEVYSGKPQALAPSVLFGPAILSEGLAIITYDEPTTPYECTREVPSLVFLDDDLETVATATLPPCVVDVAAARQTDGLFGVKVRPAELLRLDRQGRVTQSVPVSTSLANRLASHRVIESASEVYVLSFQRDSAKPGHVSAHDPVTLELKWEIEVDDPHHAQIGAENDLGVLDGPDVRFYDIANGGQTFSVPVEGLCGGNLDPRQWLIFSDSFVVSVVGLEAGVRVVSSVGGRLCGRGFPFETLRGDPYALAKLPNDLVAVGVTDTSGRASVSRFDPAGLRFLPGSVEVGRGIVGRLDVARGLVFATMSWAGEIARLEARPEE
ncbi:MAG: hypothetical protein HYV07_14770 [Deltaproteobacteria bacterium]|nr:hypothetical protein [Deltaproteobacteria bacterium]